MHVDDCGTELSPTPRGTLIPDGSFCCAAILEAREPEQDSGGAVVRTWSSAELLVDDVVEGIGFAEATGARPSSSGELGVTGRVV